ncbi:MAG TPA: SDR family NAD(P)-dependent oxidoreductase [Solirubrobacterales bacterium]|jgi:NAD(P)-dependent dehydrogenase (short-subunit alcohol dehydrogenase family)|nr:SDR family NAD(P)-dependent oxidoreductase [Solirubrobacterales bacterium]
MTRLEGTVLVTGGTGALGTAVVGELLTAGARVVSTWIVPEQRDRVEEELGSHEGLELCEADCSTEEGAATAVAAATTAPPLAAAVNLIGGYASGGRLHEAPADELQRMLELNLMTAYWTTRAALSPMLEQGGGSIVCVGAKGTVQPFKGSPAYNVAKTAVVGLVRAVAVDYRDDGIRANAVLPSVIDTPANREQMPNADHSKWVPPVQIARVIRFLCGPDSAPTSGAAIPVYGRSG